MLFSINFFFKGITFDWICLFCNGVLSTSKSRYYPPCKSKPRLIFFFKKKLLESEILEKQNKLTAKKER